MRETTYRYWDKNEKKMYYDVEKTYDWEFMPIETGENDEFVLMQYVGLKDKKGKKIYEGDIIKECDDMVMLVSWSEKYASFCLDKKGWMFSHYFGEAINPDESEVIGNIYQNPNLLK